MGKKRILIVDDDPAMTFICRAVLEQAGLFDVCEENNGKRTLETARLFRPDAILLDWDLHDIHGTAIAAELRAHSDLKAVPITYLTGSITKTEADNGVFGTPALAKPFTGPELLHAIRGLFTADIQVAA